MCGARIDMYTGLESFYQTTLIVLWIILIQFRWVNLNKLLEIAVDNKKYLFIHDKTNQGETFFKYSGAIICDMSANILKTEMKKQTIQDSMEDMRK